MSLVDPQLYCGFSRNAIEIERCCIHSGRCFISADTFKAHIDQVLKKQNFPKPKSIRTVWSGNPFSDLLVHLSC